jgi:hypothetical protein
MRRPPASRALLALTLGLSSLACESTVGTAPDARPMIEADAAVLAPAIPELHRLIHVAVTAGPNADGTRDRPFGSLVAAYALAESGDVILLGPGDYGTIEPPPPGLSLRGSGISTTLIHGPLALNAGQSLGALTLLGSVSLGADAELSDVLVRDTAAPVIIVVGAATLVDVELRGITAGDAPPEDRPDAAVVVREAGVLRWFGGVVEGSAVSAIRVDGGQITARALDLSGNHGFGLYQDGGQAQLNDLRIYQPWGAGLRFIEAEVHAERLTIIEPQIDPTQNTGTGVGFIGATGRVAEVYVRGGDRAFRANLGADLLLEDAFSDRPLSDGLGVGQDSSVTVNGLTVVAPRNSGASITGGHAQFNNVLVRDAGRLGVLVSANGTLEADGVTVVGHTVRGIALLNASGTLRGLVLEDALDGCLQITDPAGPVTVDGAILRRCGTTGLGVLGDGDGAITLRNVTIEDTYDAGQGLAIGLHIYQAAATVIGLTSQGNVGAGLQVEDGTAVIRDSLLVGNGGPGGVVIGSTVAVRFEGITAERNHGAGLLVIQGEAIVSQPNIADNIADLEQGTGDGIAGFLQAHVTVEGGYSLDNEGSGVSLTRFSRGVVTGGVRLEGNGAWGLEVGCSGSGLDAPLDASIAGNTRGDQSPCN